MRKILAALAATVLSFSAHAAEGDLREIKLGVGATQYQILTPFPAAGTKCLRYMDGSDGSTANKTLGCFAMGPQFVVDAQGVLTVPLTTGPQGAAGVSITGPQGPVGSTGAQGPAGISITGAQGPAGLDGAKGEKGDPGTSAPTPPARVQASATRTLGSIFQPSATRDVLALYSVQITTTSTVSAGQAGDVVLEIASNSAFNANVQTVGIASNSQVYSVAVAIQGVQVVTGQVSGMIPAGYYARLRTVSTSGAPTFAYRAGQEISL